jgi:hypothetical protein
VSDIFRQAKKLGIEFEEEEEKNLSQLSELTELLEEAENRRARLEQAGEDTTAEDQVIPRLRAKIAELSRKLR